MSYVGIIFRPRLIALFSSIFFFYCQFTQFKTYYLNAQECFLKTRTRKKWTTDVNFQAPPPPKVEMDGANAGNHSFAKQF